MIRPGPRLVGQRYASFSRRRVALVVLMGKDMRILRSALMGAVAGAAGTLALDMASYADMAVRGRPASSVPARLAAVLADRFGISQLSTDKAASDEKARNRQSGVGALLGYVTGLGVGTAYGLLRPHVRGVPTPLAGVGVGLAAMAASDIPIVALGVSDPATWGVSGWLSDLVPHLAYGIVTAATNDGMSRCTPIRES